MLEIGNKLLRIALAELFDGSVDFFLFDLFVFVDLVVGLEVHPGESAV